MTSCNVQMRKELALFPTPLFQETETREFKKEILYFENFSSFLFTFFSANKNKAWVTRTDSTLQNSNKTSHSVLSRRTDIVGGRVMR